MTYGDPDLVLVGPARPLIVQGLERAFTVHRMTEAPAGAMSNATASNVCALAVTYSSPKPSERVSAELMRRFPKLAIVSSFGVGFDHVDAAWAAARGIIVTNTPEVLNEEVADTALGLLLCTVRELPQSERYLRAGKWREAPYPLSTATLRDRTVGLLGMGRIGQAIARRLEAFGVPTVYHARSRNAVVAYRHYPSLLDMARDVDILLCIVPGGSATRNLVDAQVLAALGPTGILINVGRGSVVDESALIAALRNKTILSAGLDVFADEPNIPKELLAMDNIVLFPHLGSASVHTRAAMEQLVVDNLLSWCSGNGPLTPVAGLP